MADNNLSKIKLLVQILISPATLGAALYVILMTGTSRHKLPGRLGLLVS